MPPSACLAIARFSATARSSVSERYVRGRRITVKISASHPDEKAPPRRRIAIVDTAVWRHSSTIDLDLAQYESDWDITNAKRVGNCQGPPFPARRRSGGCRCAVGAGDLDNSEELGRRQNSPMPQLPLSLTRRRLVGIVARNAIHTPYSAAFLNAAMISSVSSRFV